MSIGVHVSFEYRVFSKYIPMSGITESDGSYIFSFLSNLHTILRNGCTNVPTNSVGWFLFVPPLWSIHSSVDGHLGCLHVLTFVNSAAMNIRVRAFFGLWFSLDVCPGV